MNENKYYLDDEAFTREILACKEAKKLSESACKSYMLLVERLARKSSYINYPQMMKEDMMGDAIQRFVHRYDAFSLYRPTIVKMLKHKKEEQNLSRTAFYKFIDEIVKGYEKEGTIDERALKHFNLTTEERENFDKNIEGLKGRVKCEGAYSFFTMMAENEFRKKLNEYYDDLNFRDHYLPIEEIYRDRNETDFRELFPEVFE